MIRRVPTRALIGAAVFLAAKWAVGEHPGASPAPPATMAAPVSLPAGHPPVAAKPGPGTGFDLPPAPEGAGIGTQGLVWDAPRSWVSEKPASAMRKAQYGIPGEGGNAECVVYYFGPGQGGSPQENAERWASQFLTADGKPGGPAQTRSVDIKGIPVLLVEAKGTYVGGMGSSAGQKPGYALLGAIARGPDAGWFFKLTGPEETVAAQRSSFDSLIQSIRKGL